MKETETVCLQIINNLETTLTHFNKLGTNFENIEDVLNNRDELLKLKDMYSHSYDLIFIKECNVFLNVFQSHLQLLKKEYYDNLNELYNKYKNILKNILYIEKKIDTMAKGT
jgi:hypothetical protein